MNEEDLSKSDLIQMVKHCRKRNAELTVERDEARAKIAELENIDALEAKIAPIIRVAEARGFERGMREAAKLAKVWDAAVSHAILALLEPVTPQKPEA
jgi:hypothetical protein